MVLSYLELHRCWHRGLINGSWRRLGLTDRIFYRAAMWYARLKSKIVNNKMVSLLKDIVKKLQTTIRKRIMEAGIEKVGEMLTRFRENGVFKWAPNLEMWLKDLRYVFWLGLSSQPPHDNWIK